MVEKEEKIPRAVPNELVAREPVLQIVITVSFSPASNFIRYFATIAATELRIRASFSLLSKACHSRSR